VAIDDLFKAIAENSTGTIEPIDLTLYGQGAKVTESASYVHLRGNTDEFFLRTAKFNLSVPHNVYGLRTKITLKGKLVGVTRGVPEFQDCKIIHIGDPKPARLADVLASSGRTTISIAGAQQPVVPTNPTGTNPKPPSVAPAKIFKSRTIPLYEFSALREFRPFGPASFAACFPHDSRVVVRSKKGLTSVYDRSTQQKLYELPESDGLPVVRISPDGKWIAMGPKDQVGPISVGIWNAETGDLVWKSGVYKTVHDFVCLDDKRVALSVAGGIRIAGPNQPDQSILENQINGYIGLAGNELVAMGGGGQLLASTIGPKPIVRKVGKPLGDSARNFNVSSDGTVAACLINQPGRLDKLFAILDVKTGKVLLHSSQTTMKDVLSVCPIPQLGILLCRGDLLNPRTIVVDLATGSSISDLRNTSNRAAYASIVSADGTTVISSGLVDARDFVDKEYSQAVDELISRGASFYGRDGMPVIVMRQSADNDLTLLKSFKRPFALQIEDSYEFSETTFTQLSSIPNLAGLHLQYQSVTAEQLEQLSAHKSLRILRLPHDLGDDVMEAVSKIQTLESIDTGYSEITNAGFGQLAKLDRLKKLNVSSGELDDPDLSFLKKMTALEELTLDFQSSDAQFKNVNGLTKLTSLTVPGGVSNASISKLSKLKELRKLELPDGIVLSKESLEALSEAKIETLNLYNSDEGAMEGLTNWKHLQSLRLGPKIGDKGIASIANLTTLESLKLMDTKVTDDGFAHLGRLTNLKTVDVPRAGFSGSGFRHLREAKNLKSLKLESSAITEAGLEGISKLPNITELHLPPQIGDAGVKHLVTMKSIEKLQIRKSKVTDDSIAYLVQLPTLSELDLRETAITDKFVDHFVTHFRTMKLTRLNIFKCEGVTQASVDKLRSEVKKTTHFFRVGF
jgi:internalin A